MRDKKNSFIKANLRKFRKKIEEKNSVIGS